VTGRRVISIAQERPPIGRRSQGSEIADTRLPTPDSPLFYPNGTFNTRYPSSTTAEASATNE